MADAVPHERHAVHVSVRRSLPRGATERCAACGSGSVFTGWFRMTERCPGCDYRFERELSLRPADELELNDGRVGVSR